jgi:ABC-type glycerol-3-phosphate transport system substrate-binding protein
MLSLALAALAGGCAYQPDSDQGAINLEPPVNLQVLVSSGRVNERFNRANLRKVVQSEVSDFSRSNPRIRLHLRFAPEEEVMAVVRKRSDLGAGPDLILSREWLAMQMAREKLTEPSGLTSKELAPLKILNLSDFAQKGGSYSALPLLLQPNLACYNRKRIAKAPASLADLLQRAQEGRIIGLSLVLDQISWTGTGFGAQDPVLKLFDTPPDQPAGIGFSPADRAKVLAWLQWLYRANTNPNIQFSDTNEDLAERLMKGEVDWISCNSAVLAILRKSLGKDLGLSVLPGETQDKPAWAVARLQMISFGRDSSPQQRDAAEQFALFLLNDYSQNAVMSQTDGVLPVNGNVIVPTKRSPELAAINASKPYAIVPSFNRAVGVRVLRTPLTRLIKRNVYGDISPEEALKNLEEIARNRGKGEGPQDAALARPIPPQAPPPSRPAASAPTP